VIDQQIQAALYALRGTLTDPEVQQGVCERLADAAADLWPEGPPAAPADLSDPDLLRVVERAIADMAP